MPSLVERTPVEILLVEDNPGDVDLTREALRDVDAETSLRVVPNGSEALSSLRGEGAYVGTPRPDLILLDLNMPKLGGHETLAELKTDPTLASIPVVVLTSSEAESDIARSYELGASAYVLKPGDLDRYLASVKALSRFWLGAVRFPNRDEHGYA